MQEQDSDCNQSAENTSAQSSPATVVPLTRRTLLEPDDAERLAALVGPVDANLKHLEKRLDVHIRNRGNEFQISGPEARVRAAEALLHQLYRETAHAQTLEPDQVHLFLQEAGVEELLNRQDRKERAEQSDEPADVQVIRTLKRSIKPRGHNQQLYVRAVRGHDISFGVGPAGTGKTYLAVACAVEALESQQVARILLVRPAVEAGEKLGFLPGDLAQKIDPYLRPLYDALYEMLGVERVNKYIERNIIDSTVGLHAWPSEQCLHHSRRIAKHYSGANENVFNAHRFWIHSSGYRRHYANRFAPRRALWSGQCH